MSEETRTRSKEFEIGRQKTVVSRILGRWPKKKGSDGPMGLTGDGEDELREIQRERERVGVAKRRQPVEEVTGSP